MTQVTVSKASRQQLLRELLDERDLRSQRDVLDALADRGVSTTQATVSRDLDEIGAVKVRVADGSLAYRLAVDPGPAAARSQLVDTLDRYVTSIASSANITVLRTPPACASPVASAVDLAELDGVLATTAGDDTVLVVVEDGMTGAEFADRIREMLGRDGR